MSVAWNVLDDEQRKDYEYVASATNRAGRIRDCVRVMRLLGVAASPHLAIPDITRDQGEIQMSEEEALRLLTS